MNTILVPMAAQVLTDKLPAYAPVADYAAILQVLTDAGVNTTDVLSALAAHSQAAGHYCQAVTRVCVSRVILLPMEPESAQKAPLPQTETAVRVSEQLTNEMS